jgi:hypothetical protein
MRHYMLRLDSWFKSYQVLKISAFGHAVSTANAAKSAQRQNFEISPKIEILVFFKNKNLYVYKRH